MTPLAFHHDGLRPDEALRFLRARAGHVMREAFERTERGIIRATGDLTSGMGLSRHELDLAAVAQWADGALSRIVELEEALAAARHALQVESAQSAERLALAQATAAERDRARAELADERRDHAATVARATEERAAAEREAAWLRLQLEAAESREASARLAAQSSAHALQVLEAALRISAGGETGLVPGVVQSRPPGNIAHHKETP